MKGLSDFYTFMSFVILVGFLQFGKNINNLAKEIWDKFVINKKVTSRLVDHNIFSLMGDIVVTSDTIAIKGKSVKTKIFRITMKVSIESVNAVISELVIDKDLPQLTDSALFNKIDSSLHEITREFNQRIRIEYEKIGLTNSDITFILSYLSPIRLNMKDIIKSRCSKIFIGNYYPSNEDKVASLLEILAYTLEYLTQNYKDAFELMNGRFDKYYWDEATKMYKLEPRK